LWRGQCRRLRRLRRREWHVRGAHDLVVSGLKYVGEGIRVVWEVVNKLLLQALSSAPFQGWRQASEEVPRLLYRGDTVLGDKVAGDEEVLAIVFAELCGALNSDARITRDGPLQLLEGMGSAA
jgi:hypothetical protein